MTDKSKRDAVVQVGLGVVIAVAASLMLVGLCSFLYAYTLPVMRGAAEAAGAVSRAAADGWRDGWGGQPVARAAAGQALQIF